MQLEIGDKKDIIETVFITPSKEMPLEVFKACHRLSFYMELMERTDDNKVIWDENIEEFYSESLAEAEYHGIQNDWFSVNMELPKPFIEQFDQSLKE